MSKVTVTMSIDGLTLPLVNALLSAAQQMEKCVGGSELKVTLENHIAAPDSWRNNLPLERRPLGELLQTLWHHQGFNSEIGQPIRELLGMEPAGRMTAAQVDAAKRWAAPLGAPLGEERAKGRAEAYAMIYNLSVDTFCERFVGSHAVGDTGDYEEHWDGKALREFLRCDDAAWRLTDEAEGMIYERAGLLIEAKEWHAKVMAHPTVALMYAIAQGNFDAELATNEARNIISGLTPLPVGGQGKIVGYVSPQALDLRPGESDAISGDMTKYRTVPVCVAGAQPESNAWRGALVDALVVACIYRAEHDADPRKAIRDLLDWERTLALDPEISADARALRDSVSQDTTRLDFIEKHRHGLVGEYEGPWDVIDYGNGDETPEELQGVERTIGTGNTIREAIDAARAHGASA